MGAKKRTKRLKAAYCMFTFVVVSWAALGAFAVSQMPGSFSSSSSSFSSSSSSSTTSASSLSTSASGRHLLQSGVPSITLSTTQTTLRDERDAEGRLYPPELLSDESIKNGGFILYFIGILYMFFALAIVCDDYFVPALEVITERLDLSPDVAGATFMAAGGSAPELFTSFLGIFIAKSNVGFGTIVGSAVFNVLFVIGACAVATRSIAPQGLELTWWPLFRDSFFYAIDLGLLTYFFYDEKIQPWESASLLAAYFVYVIFMKYSPRVQGWVEDYLQARRHKAYRESVIPSYNNSPNLSRPSFTKFDFNMELTEVLTDTVDSPRKANEDVESQEVGSRKMLDDENEGKRDSGEGENNDGDGDDDDDDDTWKPQFPSDGTIITKVTFLVLFPLNFPLWLTLPCCKDEAKHKYFVVAFFGSIVWIAIFSYFMVWWADTLGWALGIPIEVMGYTILAAGTSVPDLITSVIVARSGEGDMAVSSSIGSNIFDVTFGLPLPWIIKSLTVNMDPVEVKSVSLGTSVVMLFAMLLATIVSIAAFGWRLNSGLGLICFLLYCIFVAISLLIEYGVIEPVF